MKTVLTLLGIIPFTLLAIVGFIYTAVKHIFIKRDYSFKKQFAPLARSLVLAFDGLANAFAGELLNDSLLKKRKNGSFYVKTIKYGKWYHTISAITGVNKKHGVLNEYGQRFNAFLDFVLGYKHSLDAINKCINYDCKKD